RKIAVPILASFEPCEEAPLGGGGGSAGGGGACSTVCVSVTPTVLTTVVPQAVSPLRQAPTRTEASSTPGLLISPILSSWRPESMPRQRPEGWSRGLTALLFDR